MTSGKWLAEKNVPDSTHIGSMIAFARPDTASTVFARVPTSRPSPLKLSAPNTAMNISDQSDPRSGT